MEKHRIIDMHTHSNASDGCLSPSEVLSYGKSKGLETMSLTDHDTLSGNRSLTDEDKKSIREKVKKEYDLEHLRLDRKRGNVKNPLTQE